MAQDTSVGTKEEKELFHDMIRHYNIAKEDLEQRIPQFDKNDILFRSYIVEADWPYRAIVFDPRVFTALFEKSARILANKPQGRLVPREGGDSLGAKIINELLMYQWDDNERVDNMPMLAKWSLMDLTARKYGAAFALSKWQYERRVDPQTKKSSIWFDGPNFRPLNNRDCLPNPSYSTIKLWFQHRDYVTLDELRTINDSARSRPVYKNLDILAYQLKEKSTAGGDTRESNYLIKNKSIRGLTDYLGRDETHKVIEVVTEYGQERWVTFSPKHGVILRDIPNPYDHGQIPVVMLRYYPIDDDLYGLDEIEAIAKMQRALNAYICQNLDTLNMSTYTTLKVRSTGGAVQMHTLEFGPGKKWLMSDPATDVIPFESNPQGVGEFATVYRMMVGAIQEGLGETSEGASNLAPGTSKKTATEIRDLAVSRSARDNYNQIFLGEAIKKQMMFWLKMDQQFMFSNPLEKQKIIRIVGKDAIRYFQNAGLESNGFTDEAIETLSSPDIAGTDVRPEDLMSPLYPVETEEGIVNKLEMDEDGQSGNLIIEPQDLSGTYDFIPDVQSMELPNQEQLIAASKNIIELAINPATSQLLMQEQYRIKFKEILEDYLEKLGMRDADKYFEKLEVNPYEQSGLQKSLPGGEPGAASGQPGVGNGGVGGVAGGSQTLPYRQTQPVLPGPV